MSVTPIRMLWAFALAAFLAAPLAGAEEPPPAAPALPAESSTAPVPGGAIEASPASAASAGPAAAIETPRPPGGGANAAAASLPRDLSAWNMFRSADHIVKGVIVGLALASIITWTVALTKFVELLLLKRRFLLALGKLEGARSLNEAQAELGDRGPAAALSRAAMAEAADPDGGSAAGIKERAASRLERIEAHAGRIMTRGTGILATIGATAPFVGLFGTVWGIMNSFIGISKAQTTNLAVVAPGIAEALLATAIGLVAAIPAVVLYNMLARYTAPCRALIGDAAASVMRLLSRDLERRDMPVPGLRRAAE
ncbi:MAG: tonB-system energizer ExbB [Alphaproteobacteria bacterium]